MFARLLAATLLTVFAFAATAVTPAAASPTINVTCYGDYCSGKDPQSSGCSADAYSVSTEYVYGSNAWVDIRWSPTCKTNWARSSVISTNIKAVQSGGYTQGYSTNNGTVAWSKMIYSPVKCVKGVIWGGWGTTQTLCV